MRPRSWNILRRHRRARWALLTLACFASVAYAPAVNAAEPATIGVLDAVSSSPGAIRARGWALGDGTQSVALHVYVDGVLSAETTSRQSRPDVAQAYPGHGDRLGFDVEFGFASNGSAHTVCAYALTDDRSNPLLGCRVLVVPVDPIGSVDVLSPAPGALVVSGWATDPDAPSAAVDVHVYVDGALRATGVANTVRPDLASALPYGPAHGFAIDVPVDAGDHQVCTYGLNVTGSAGGNALIECRSVSRSGDPVGWVRFYAEPLGTTAQRRIVEGYLVDPDTDAPVDVHTYRFVWNHPGPQTYDRPTFYGQVRADGPSAPAGMPEGIATAFARFGGGHGFSADVTFWSGLRLTCAYAINAPGTPGNNVLLGCTGEGSLFVGTVGGPFA